MPELNAPLLLKTLHHIEAHPAEWRQAFWRKVTPCGTSFCFAGWACELDGGEWLDSDGSWSEWLVPEADERPTRTRKGDAVHVMDRARRVLGLTHKQALELFKSDNDLPTLRSIVAALLAESEYDWS